jgi:hypothetical protein
MDYKVIDIAGGQQLEIDLPLDITAMNFSVIFYDAESKENRSSHIGYWMVDDSSSTPKNFKIPIKEFQRLSHAVRYAQSIYVKYLKEEIRRVKGVDDEI